MANDEKPQQDAAKAPPPGPAEALSNAHKVEELADKLSECADSIHQRVMRDIRRHQGQDVPEPEQMAARALLNAEMELRKRITRIGDGITLVARLLGLAAAASTGQVMPILAAVEGLKTQLDIVAVDNAPAPSA